MDKIRTNRDFYLFICKLAETQEASSMALEEFLARLEVCARALADRVSLRADEFAQLLECAITADAALPAEHGRPQEGFKAWEEMIHSQQNDLISLRAEGFMDDPMSYFGVRAPGGESWYNLHLQSYLECAAAGWCGGWAPNDSSGRLPTGEDAEADHVEPLKEFNWEELADFLYCGQVYE